MIIAFIITMLKLMKAEKDFSNAVKREHKKTLQGIARYNAMKNQPKLG